jgi:hypothetical protein
MRRRKIAFASLLLLVAAIPLTASGANLGYTFAGADYVNFDIDRGPEVDGPGIYGAFALMPQLHAYGAAARLTNGRARLAELNLALGYNAPIAEATDLVARVGLARRTVRVRNLGSDTENAVLLQAGLRALVTPELELSGFLTFADFDDSMTSLDVGGVYSFSPMYAMTLGAGFASERNFYSIGLRVILAQ